MCQLARTQPRQCSSEASQALRGSVAILSQREHEYAPPCARQQLRNRSSHCVPMSHAAVASAWQSGRVATTKWGALSFLAPSQLKAKYDDGGMVRVEVKDSKRRGVGRFLLVLIAIGIAVPSILFGMRSDSPVSHDELMNGRPPTMDIRISHGAHGVTDSFALAENGSASWMTVLESGPHSRSRTLSPAELTALRNELDDDGFFALGNSYVDRSRYDGVSADYTVRVGEHEKCVHCGNEFPAAILSLRSFVFTRLAAAYAPSRLSR